MIDFSIIEDDSSKIEYINEISNIISNGQITPEKINECLGNYFTISVWLTTVLESVELLNGQTKLEYKIWESEAKTNARLLLEQNITTKSAKPSASDIESKMIVDNKNEYHEWQSKLLNLERKEGFYRRLCDSWKAQSQMLINISQNARSEMYSLHVENKVKEDTIVLPKRKRVN